jgi:hypothetical protein
MLHQSYVGQLEGMVGWRRFLKGGFMFPANDFQFEDKKVTRVDKNSIETEDGWSFFIPDDPQIIPEVGMIARFYGEGIGRPVRGLFLEGIQVFYKTPEEHLAERKKEHEEYEAECERRKLEPMNPDPQIEGFEWTNDMREISGFHADYEQACRKMVSQGCKWWNEHTEKHPQIHGFKGIYGIATADNEDAKELEKAMMVGVEDCSGAMHQGALAHIFHWKQVGTWFAYQEKMRELKKTEAVES